MNKYNSNITLGTVVLNVANINKMIEFYQKALGMSIIKRDSRSADLGTEDGKVLLELKEIEGSFVRSYGLYHVAYLVPTRENLADILTHFIKSGVALIGASDHGYSEAIYLEDPEGNGIEVYQDKDVSVWDIREDGRIIGVTEPLKADELLSHAKEVNPYKLAVGTIVGHVHLSVKDAMQSTKFYQQVLNFKDKMTVPSGSWIAQGNYHHHLAVNSWSGPNLALREKGMLGLSHFNIIATDVEFSQMVKNIEDNTVNVVERGEDYIIITDPNGIEVHIRK